MITIENTSYGYKSNPLIFNNISLEIGNGIYGLLGENGVGKTTLMHLICGLLFPKNGKCSIDGRNTAERQSEGLARYFFLPESIASFAARHSVFYPHFNQEEFKLNLEELKINRKQKLSSVSYGQQKKAMLAYAFALHTPYILLDEPTNGLDITSRQALKRIISRSMDDESTLLISTHQAHDFENLLDHLVILGKGEILLNRSLDEISNRLLFARTDILQKASTANKTCRAISPFSPTRTEKRTHRTSSCCIKRCCNNRKRYRACFNENPSYKQNYERNF